ncbi:MAG: hypothetical protein ACFFKA_08690 [Candidatus Thorarchaeota archaeon]
MLEKKTIKIDFDESQIKIPSNLIGLDIGYSLSKIATYKNKELYVSILDTNSEIEELKKFIISHIGKISSLNFTGGKAFSLYKQYRDSFNVKLINEFEANVRGLKFLYLLQKNKPLPPSIVVSIGTGTSMVLNRDQIEHIGGTALGGGFFMGFAKLVYKLSNYQEAIELTNKGKRYEVDLKVGDIYDKEDSRVNKLFREFTAASFGKLNHKIDLSSIDKRDVLSAINAMLAENIGTIATLLADNYNIPNIIFCGGFLINNIVLKQILSLLCKIRNKKAIFLEDSEIAGALGSMVYD